MNVASLGLCKELYELSGWRAASLVPIVEGVEEDHDLVGFFYDLGYLRRKLPHKHNRGVLVVAACNVDEWCAQYYSWYPEDRGAKTHVSVADTPENALSLLAIELFKAGVLTKVTGGTDV